MQCQWKQLIPLLLCQRQAGACDEINVASSPRMVRDVGVESWRMRSELISTWPS